VAPDGRGPESSARIEAALAETTLLEPDAVKEGKGGAAVHVSDITKDAGLRWDGGALTK
jgi:hypothetical protein